MRINKFLSHHNIASRRETDSLINEGKVLVNGKPAVLGMDVTEADDIKIVGNTKKRVYYAYHKPRGIITHSPAAHEVDIVTQVQKDHGITDVYPVGRLDKDSEGLIILTNDGRVTTRLVGEEAEVRKTYVVTVDKKITGHFLKHMEEGVDIEGYLTKPAEAQRRSDTIFTLTLTEGKKHQIRRMCAALGYQVQRLQRTNVGSVGIDGLKTGQVRKLAAADFGL